MFSFNDIYCVCILCRAWCILQIQGSQSRPPSASPVRSGRPSAPGAPSPYQPSMPSPCQPSAPSPCQPASPKNLMFEVVGAMGALGALGAGNGRDTCAWDHWLWGLGWLVLQVCDTVFAFHPKSLDKHDLQILFIPPLSPGRWKYFRKAKLVLCHAGPPVTARQRSAVALSKGQDSLTGIANPTKCCNIMRL